MLAFARDSQRPRSELEASLFRKFGFEIVLILGMSFFFLTTFAPVLIFQGSRWASYEPIVGFSASRWLVLFESGKQCEELVTNDCYGHPQNETLWSSRLTTADKEYSNQVKQFQSKDFWIGLQVTKDEVERAKIEKGFALGLGMFNSEYRIYVNGELVDTGTGRDILPVVVSLSPQMLSRNSEIRVAVNLKHNLGSRIPVWFVPSAMNGIFTNDSAKAMVGFWNFALSYRPLINTIWAFVFAFAFGLLWASVPRKVEYFYFSLYMFVYSLTQVLPFAPIAWGADRPVLYERTYWLIAFEGTLGALLGASYARTRKVYSFWVILIGIIVSLGGYFSSGDQVELYFFKDALMKYFIPAMFLLGSIFCFSQGVLLKKDWSKFTTASMALRRQRRLSIFGGLLLSFGLVFYYQNSIMSVRAEYWERTIQMALLGLIGLNLFADYRDRERQFEIVHRSPFHDPFGGSSPEIFGFLLSLDLIKSSAIANFSMNLPAKMKPITLWNAKIGQLMSQHSGFKVGDEGDGLKIFFRYEETDEDLNRVVAAIKDAYRETRNLESRLLAEGLITPDLRLRFRSGLVWGGVHPIWKEIAGVKSAEWEDARGFSTFKDSQRVMEVQKSLEENRDHTLVVSTKVELTGSSLGSKRIHQDVKDVGVRSLLLVSLEDGEVLKAAS